MCARAHTHVNSHPYWTLRAIQCILCVGLFWNVFSVCCCCCGQSLFMSCKFIYLLSACVAQRNIARTHKVYLVSTGKRKFIERFFVKFFDLWYTRFFCCLVVCRWNVSVCSFVCLFKVLNFCCRWLSLLPALPPYFYRLTNY